MFRLLFLTITCFIISSVTLWWAFDEPSADNAEFHNETQAQLVARIKAEAETGSREAQFALGEYYRDGAWVPVDKRKAFEMFFKSAQQSYAPAMIAAGKAYENGEGVKRSFAKAAEWYLLAGRSFNSAEGQFLLGQMYFSGKGVPHDYDKAYQWHSKAARNGHPGAQYLMGAMHESGWGVPLDFIKAYYWYHNALKNEVKPQAVNKRYNPIEAIARLNGKMKRHELEKAQELVARSPK